MKTPFFYLLIAIILLSGCNQPLEGDLIITKVNIIDVETGEVHDSKDAVIAGDKIASIVEHQNGRSYRGKVIDGTGKYLIPGLWNMHVHSGAGKFTRSIDLPLFVAHGVTGVELACSRQEEELRVKYRRQVEEISTDTTLQTHIPVWNRTEWEPLATWDPEKCRALYRHLAAHRIWIVPTLVIQHHISYASDPAIKDDPRQRYLPSSWWDPEGIADWFDPDRQLRPTFEHRLRSIPELHSAGVGILAGSDMVGGFPLHDELTLFVETGLSPLDALRTATLNPATYLKATDSLGTVEAGRLADLVLLDANPLEDISNTQKIRAVVLNGRYLDRGALDKMLADAEQAAKEKE